MVQLNPSYVIQQLARRAYEQPVAENPDYHKYNTLDGGFGGVLTGGGNGTGAGTGVESAMAHPYETDNPIPGRSVAARLDADGYVADETGDGPVVGAGVRVVSDVAHPYATDNPIPGRSVSAGPPMDVDGYMMEMRSRLGSVYDGFGGLHLETSADV